MALIDNAIYYWKLDDTSGDATDIIASKVLTNTSVTYSTGIVNNGAVFNGSAKLKSAASNSYLYGLTDFTISVWVKTSSTSKYIVSEGAGNYVVMGISAAGKLDLTVDAGAATSSSTSINTNSRVHCVMTYTGGKIYGYINGILDASLNGITKTFDGSITSRILCLGSEQAATALAITGTIDEVGIWSRALSATEVLFIYNIGDCLQYPFTINNIHPNRFVYASSSLFNQYLLSLTDSDYSYKIPTDIIRVANETAVSGNYVACSFYGIDSGNTGLTGTPLVPVTYYLNATPGSIGTSAGTNSFVVGKSIKSDQLRIRDMIS